MTAPSTSTADLAPVTHLRTARDPSDEELVTRARQGEIWAKEVIYRRYAKPITGVAARLLGNASEAEDLCQDTFVSAFQDLKRLQDPKALRSWLTSIAVHRAHKIFRRRKLRRKLGLAHGETELPALLHHPVSGELCSAMLDISRILDAASASQRSCWWLRHGEGYALQEVADMHGCSLATAKRRIAVLHKKLATLVETIDSTGSPGNG